MIKGKRTILTESELTNVLNIARKTLRRYRRIGMPYFHGTQIDEPIPHIAYILEDVISWIGKSPEASRQQKEKVLLIKESYASEKIAT